MREPPEVPDDDLPTELERTGTAGPPAPSSPSASGEDATEIVPAAEAVQARRIGPEYVEGDAIGIGDGTTRNELIDNQVHADGAITEFVEGHYIESPGRTDVQHAASRRRADFTIYLGESPQHHVSTRACAQIPVTQQVRHFLA